MSASAWESALKMTGGNEAEAEKFLRDNGVNASAKRVLTLREKSAMRVFDTLGGEDRLDTLRSRLGHSHERITQLFLNSLTPNAFENIISDSPEKIADVRSAREQYYKANFENIDAFAQIWGSRRAKRLLSSQNISSNDEDRLIVLYRIFMHRLRSMALVVYFSEIFDVLPGDNRLHGTSVKVDSLFDMNASIRENLNREQNGPVQLSFVLYTPGKVQRIVMDLGVRVKDFMRVVMALRRGQDFTVSGYQPIQMSVVAPQLRIFGLTNNMTLAEVMDPNGFFPALDTVSTLAMLSGMKTDYLENSDALDWILNGVDGMIINPAPGVDLAERQRLSGLDSRAYIQKMMDMEGSNHAQIIRDLYRDTKSWFVFDDIDGLVQKLVDDPSLLSIKLEDVASPVTDPAQLVQEL